MPVVFRVFRVNVGIYTLFSSTSFAFLFPQMVEHAIVNLTEKGKLRETLGRKALGAKSHCDRSASYQEIRCFICYSLEWLFILNYNRYKVAV